MKNLDQLVKLNEEINALLHTLAISPIREVEQILRDKISQLAIAAEACDQAPGAAAASITVAEELQAPEEAAEPETEPELPAEEPELPATEVKNNIGYILMGDAVVDEIPTIAYEPAVSTPVAEIKAEDAPMRLDEKIKSQSASDFSKAFSINDKYRFTRELFNNSAAEFTDAVNMVTAMKSLDEAYDYFLNDLGWDVDNDAASEFLVIVANHFNAVN